MKNRELEVRLRQHFNEQFQPVQQELAALVTIVRQLEQSYQQIGKAVANVEYMLKSWDEAVWGLRDRIEMMTPPPPPPKPKGKAKVLPFKRKKS